MNIDYIHDSKSLVESLALAPLSYEAVIFFGDFLWIDFHTDKHKEYFNNKIFSDEELKFLYYIYILIEELWNRKHIEEQKWLIDVRKDWKIHDEDTKYILETIERFLSLPSMERYMAEIRKNPYYKWIWDFY